MTELRTTPLQDIPDSGLGGLGQEYNASAADGLETDNSLGAQMEQFYNLSEQEAAAVSSDREVRTHLHW